MGSGATAKYALPYPLPTDNPHIEGDIQALAAAIEAIMVAYVPDNTLANRPAAGKVSRRFTESAASLGLPGTTWRDDGASWRALGSRVQANAAGDIAQIVKAFAGQTANIEEWQSSAGGVLAHVSPSGYIRTAGKIQAGTLTDVPSTTLAVINAFGGGTVAAIIRGAAGGTGDLTQWQDSSGAVKSTISASGIYNVSGIAYIGDTSASATTLLRSGVAGNVALNVQGAASQTGDLMQWTSSVGAVIARIRADGLLGDDGGGNYINGPTGITASIIPRAASAIGLRMRAAVSGTADLMEWQDSSGVVQGGITSQGFFWSGSGGFPGGMIGVRIPTPTFRGAVVQGAAAQAADLQQWNDSTPTTLARVDSGGFVYSRGVSVSNAPNTGASLFTQVPVGQGSGVAAWLIRDQPGQDLFRVMPTGQIFNQVNAAATVGQIVKGFTSQTADLTQWQDSTAAALARITAGGSLVVAGAAPRSAIGSAGPLSVTALAVSPGPGETGVIPLAARGVASQTADLQEWQSSTGQVNASVAPDGAIYSRSFMQASTYSLHGAASRYGASNTAIVSVNTGAAGNEGAIIRGVASQTADLQQWQTNAGVPLVRVIGGTSASGLLATMQDDGITGAAMFYSGTTPTGAARGYLRTGSVGTKGLVLEAKASQTANLLEVQNSAVVVIAAITATGNVQGTGAYTALSDASVKMNVKDLHLDPLDVVRRLRPVHFDYIGGERDQVGFVAQEVEPILPHAVTPFDQLYGGIPDYDGRLGLRTDAILAYLVAATQRIDSRLAALEAA